MLHIIGILLKFIGIVLLLILGLILALLLVILLVPIRYRVWVTHGEMFHLDTRVSWILHIIHLRVTQEEEQRRIRLRIFGILFYDSARPRKPKKLRKSRRKAARDRKQYAEHGRASARSPGKKNTGAGAEHKEIHEEQRAHKVQEASDVTTVSEQSNTGTAGIKIGVRAEQTEEAPAIDEAGVRSDQDSKVSIFRKIILRMKHIAGGIRNTLHRLRLSIHRIWKTIINLKGKIGLVKDFISNEENKEAFGITYGSLKKLLKHVIPRKLRSKVVFGTGDPCSTGQALGVISTLYGLYGEHVQITPDFENKVFEGSHYARGRIRIGTLLIIVIKLLLDKKMKRFMRNFKRLKEAL